MYVIEVETIILKKIYSIPDVYDFLFMFSDDKVLMMD